MPERRRPGGVVAIVIYTAILGVVSVVGGIAGLGLVNLDGTDQLGILYLVLLLAGVLALTTVYGLWTFQRWGLVVARALYVLWILVDIGFLLVGEGTVLTIVELILAVVVLSYLLHPRVHKVFAE